MIDKLPIVVGITGASGSIYALKLIDFLLNKQYKIDLILTENAINVINQELGLTLINQPDSIKTELLNYLKVNINADLLKVYNNTNMFAAVSSGSYITQGMIIVPCSMNTLAAIKTGITSNLITRAADVNLKQGKKLILSPREIPFNSIHLENMYHLSLRGVKIVVPSAAFYNHPQTIDDIINYVVGKILDSFEVSNDLYKRWE